MSWHSLSSDVTNLCDIIDTRKVLQRIEELESDHLDEENCEVLSAASWNDDDWDEYSTLKKLIDEVRDNSNESPEDGVTLIRETYFDIYIQEGYFDGMGPELYEYDHKTHYYKLVPFDELATRPPFNRIDWAVVARDERSDYSEITFDGVDYYYL